MSNNKQTMKLYTEEQIKNAYTQIWADGGHDKYSLSGLEEMLEQLIPIELPSDEEIENGYEPKTMYDLGYLDGAKWMRDKIQGGDNVRLYKNKFTNALMSENDYRHLSDSQKSQMILIQGGNNEQQ